ncbi:MAG: hypothetical protein JST00_30235 [Deltaproteobacteria bacterium]|nr:hypothetical protein [Deltaproteobacteria bacterium]
MIGSNDVRRVGTALVLLLVLPGGCKTAEVPATRPDPKASASASAPLSPPPPAAKLEQEREAELPPPAKAMPTDELARDVACGPWSTKDLAKTESSLLGDRVRVRFFAGAKAAGDESSGKIEVEKGGHTLFYGAREMFQRGDDLFERRAAKAALFGGAAYEAMTIQSSDGKTPIVTGVRKRVADANGDLVAIAHGWFLDSNRDVLDVAIFVSKGAVKDSELEACRLFAAKLVSTATAGPKRLAYGTGAATESQVSYAKFSYVLPQDWVLVSSAGIHDFARMRFRKRGPFPNGYTELQMALDSHPGDWKSEGDPDGERSGRLLGLPVKWHLTKEASGPFFGAWTVSDGLTKNDHAVASIMASAPADRDSAIAFAESIKAGR